MKVLDVISATIPNVFKDKSPKKVAYKKKKNVYGGLETSSTDGDYAMDGSYSSTDGASTDADVGGAQ